MAADSGPDGVTHATRKSYNSAIRRTQIAEMRKLGSQAVTIERETEADGSVRDAMDRHNLEESELGGLRRRWDTRQTSSNGSTRRRHWDRLSSDRCGLKRKVDLTGIDAIGCLSQFAEGERRSAKGIDAPADQKGRPEIVWATVG
jgi:hypothetical protein